MTKTTSLDVGVTTTLDATSSPTQTGLPVSSTTAMSVTDSFQPAMTAANLNQVSEPAATLSQFFSFVPREIPKTEADWATFFSQKLPLGLVITDHVFGADDPFVKQSVIREHAALALAQRYLDQSIWWDEQLGILEFGSGVLGSLKLAPWVSLAGGITGSGLVRYHAVRPLIGGKDGHEQPMFLPLDAASALNMIEGSLVEMAVRGKLNLWGQVVFFAGQALGVANAGIGLKLGADASFEDEYSVKVTALANHKVRLTITKIDQESLELQAKAFVGLNFGPGSLIPTNIAGGILYYISQKLGPKFFEQWLTNYTTLQAYVQTKLAHKGTEIVSLDFDLTSPRACESYNEAIGLRTGKALELAQDSTNSGVTRVLVGQRECSTTLEAGVSLFGDKLFLADAIGKSEGGEVTGTDDKRMVYRDYSYQRDDQSVISGDKKIVWEVVSVRASEDQEAKPFFHFVMNEHKKRPSQADVDQLVRFFSSLRVKPNGENQLTLSPMSTCAYLHSSIDVNCEIFVTLRGIDAINNADKNAGKEAFLSACCELDPKYAAVPLFSPDHIRRKEAFEILDDYLQYRQKRFSSPCGDVAREFRQDYFACSGRTTKQFDEDYELYERAAKFGEHIEKLTDIKSPRHLAHFFLRLGKEAGFAYQEIIAALNKLAGCDETLVHRASIQGSGIKFVVIDEGAFIMPQKQIEQMLDRAA